MLGASLTVRGAAIRQAGLLDEGYFMYCEEMDWQQRLARTGWEVYCVPAARVVHHGGASTSQFRAAMFTVLWQSRLRYFDRYLGPITNRLLRGLIRAGMAAEAGRARRNAPPDLDERLRAYETVRAATAGRQAVKLIAVILTKNEARHIADCIASVASADGVLVSDSFSDDDTAALAEAAGAVVEQRVFEGWAVQRNASLDTAARLGADWVLFVDADERCTPELAKEVREVIETRPEAGWSVPRYNFIVGKQVRHGGFYPDYQLRLLRVGRARYDLSRPVHEVVELDGSGGPPADSLVALQLRHLGAVPRQAAALRRDGGDILAQRGIRARPHNFILQPLREFRRRYLTLQGYRDGWHGLKLCALLAYYYGFYPYWVLRS